MIIKSLDATSLYKLLGTSAARKRAPEIIPTVLGVVARCLDYHIGAPNWDVGSNPAECNLRKKFPLSACVNFDVTHKKGSRV